MEQEIRRLKRLFKDPNPLFTAWLTEWRQEADRKDSNMKYVYGTALKSLRQYPLPIASGKSCNILKGFGVTLCTRLDERLQKYIEQHGPLPALGVADRVEIAGAKSKPASKKRTPKPKPTAILPEQQPSQSEAGLPQSQSGRKAGEYRPKPGSGGFALLVALRQQEEKHGYAGFLRKAALQEAVQPLCSASMTLPEAGGYYTSWSTMTTLVKRKLVLREGNPARFSLTAAGRDAVDRLEATRSAVPSQRDCFDRLAGSPGSAALAVSPGSAAGRRDRRAGLDGPPGSPTGRGGRLSPARSTQRAEDGVGRRSPLGTGTGRASPEPGSAPLPYHYVSSAGAQVQSKDEAAVSVEGGRVGFLVCCRQTALDASGRSFWSDPSRAERDGVVHVFLADSDCAEICPAGPLSRPPPAVVPRAGPGPSRPGSTAATGTATTAAGRPRRLHDMSDSESDGEPMSSQTQSRSLPQPLPQSLSQSQSQSLPQSLPQSQSRSQAGAALKRQPTDWSAALKRLRTDSSGGDRPTASSSISASTASAASSSAAPLLSDDDFHLLSDDDDGAAGSLAAKAAPSRLSPATADDFHLLSDDDDDDDAAGSLAAKAAPSRLSPATADDIPLTRRVNSAASRKTTGLAGSRAGPSASEARTARDTAVLATSRVETTARTATAVGTAARDRSRPPTAAEQMRERVAAAAEARARGRPPASTAAEISTKSSLSTKESSKDCPLTQTKATHRPVMKEGSGRPAGGVGEARDRQVPEAVAATTNPSAETSRNFTPSVVLQPDTFDILLCVDNQETSGKSGQGACLRTYRDVVLTELQKNGVVADVRKLSVGDFLWVARPRTGKQPVELVLPYVVERKRLDDLASSIRDNRYREQKFRLKRCGLANVIYLAEGMGTGPRAQSVRLPESTLQQALANCQVVDGFRVKWTADQRETAAFLTLMTRRLQRQYQYRQLEGCPRDLLPASPSSPGQPERLQLFSEFHQLSAKRQRLTAGDIFAKMLLQLSGLSPDKAAAIVTVYPTLARLAEGYRRCGSPAEAEGLLTSLRAEKTGRPVGSAVSKAVYHLYSDKQLV